MKKLSVLLFGILASINIFAATDSVKIITTGTDPFTPLTLLPHFCKKHDLAVELTQTAKFAPSTGATILARGDYDIAVSTLTVTLNAVQSGTELAVAAAVVDGGDVLISRNDIKTVKELKGKKVAALKGTGQEFYLMKTLKEAGLTYSGEKPDVTIVQIPLDIQPIAFENGNVDAFTAVYPYSVQYADAKKGRILAEFSENQRALYAQRAFFKTEKSKKFYKCYEEAFKAIDDKTKAAEVDNAIAYARTLGLRTAVIPKGEYAFKPNRVMRDSSIQEFVDFMKANNMIKPDFVVPTWFNNTKTFTK